MCAYYNKISRRERELRLERYARFQFYLYGWTKPFILCVRLVRRGCVISHTYRVVK